MKLLHTNGLYQENSDIFVHLVSTEQLINAEINVDQAVKTEILSQLSLVQFEAKFAESSLIIQNSKQHLFIGIGDASKFNASQAQKIGQQLVKAIQNKQVSAAVELNLMPEALQSVLLLSACQANYQFQTYKSKKSAHALQQLRVVSSDLEQNRLDFLMATANGQSFARDLGNQPGNVCFPEYLAEQALQLAQQYPDRLKVTVLEQTELAELGLNAFVAVSKGSERSGRLVILEYKSSDCVQNQPMVLVGKGVTFDTGGISLKPAAGMDEMKFDMCGAASVLGVMRSLCESNLAVSVVGAIACAENMPSSNATKPGDIVTTLSGQTVEILNTDAEGRLVLCDTLTYIKRYNPTLVIDIATLTGACVVALGKVVSGLFSNDQQLANDLIAAGQKSHDRVWQMPILDDYQELLDSPFADIANIGGPTAGSITAACFLQRFCKDYRWAHLDIAGTAWLSGAQKGATGRPVPLLVEFIANQAELKV